MMQKHGEMTFERIAALVLVSAVLVMIAVFAIGQYQGFDFFAKLLPSFNFSKTTSASLEVFRYRLVEDRTEWYDGLNWKVFSREGNITLNGKTFVKSEIEDVLKQRYYQGVRTAPRKIVLNERTFVLIHSKPYYLGDTQQVFDKSSWQSFLDYVYDAVTLDAFAKQPAPRQRGDVVVSVFVDSKVAGWMRISAKDNQAFVTFLEKNVKIDEARVREETVRWRDEVFKQPVEIPYVKKDEKFVVSVCIEKDGADLRIDVRNEQERCA